MHKPTKYEKQKENQCFRRFIGSLHELKCEKQMKISVSQGLGEACTR